MMFSGREAPRVHPANVRGASRRADSAHKRQPVPKSACGKLTNGMAGRQMPVKVAQYAKMAGRWREWYGGDNRIGRMRREVEDP